MGTWGTGIYSNDVSEEVRDTYIDFLEDGLSHEEAMHLVFEKFSDYLQDSNDIYDLWFALADTQSSIGRLHPKVKEFALELIEEGGDTKRWTDSGNQSGASERQQVLAQLKEKLLGSQPPEKKIERRPAFKCPWQIGDLFAYRLENETAVKSGLAGRYVIIQKVKEITWHRGSIVPMVIMRMSATDQLPDVEETAHLEIVKTLGTGRKIHRDVTVLESESLSSIPSKLIFLGNSEKGTEEFGAIEAEALEYGYMIWETLEDDVIRDYKVFNINKSPSVIQPPPGWAKEAIAIVEERMYARTKGIINPRKGKPGKWNGLDILMDTYWCRLGWKDGEISPSDFLIAKEQGYMFDYPEPYTHEEALMKAKELVQRIHPDDVANAFLYSLSTRKLEYRSALGSYYYLRGIPDHQAVYRYKTCEYCGFSMFKENPDDREKRHGLNVLNFERYKWGGVRQDKPHYAIFDLEMFEKLPKVHPQREDLVILKDVLSLASQLEPSKKIGPYVKLIGSEKIIKSNKNEIRVMLQILGICDVFNSKDAKGYLNHFTESAFDRDPVEHTNDFMYPANRWQVCDGINWDAVRFVFKDALEEFKEVYVVPTN